MSKKFSIKYVENFFSEMDHSIKYIKFHKIRYCYLLNHLVHLVNNAQEEKVRILDIGPMHQTVLFRKSIDNLIVDTMGEDFITNELSQDEVHYEIDLNYTENFKYPIDRKYDVITFSEVIEHLYTKPEIVLQFISRFLKNKGYLILQTPNGLAIHHRIKLLFGIHPYQQINEYRNNHFREYSLKELEDIYANCGLKVIHKEIKNYFNNDSTFLNRAYVNLEAMIPQTFRDGITIIGQWEEELK